MNSEHIHVWQIDTRMSDEIRAALEEALDPEELRRADRFAKRELKDAYVVTHGCLRQLLEMYLDRPAESFRFSKNEYGKPHLDPNGMKFNISHSGNVALMAFSPTIEVGIDVERERRDLNFLDLAKRYFSPKEATLLESAPDDELEGLFFRCWTRKEAYIKADGRGLSLPLDSFSALPDPPAGPLTIESPHPQPCSIHDIDLKAAGYRAALACFGEAQEIVVNQWDRRFGS